MDRFGEREGVDSSLDSSSYSVASHLRGRRGFIRFFFGGRGG